MSDMAENLFDSKEMQQLTQQIAKEFADRNLFPLRDFGLFIKDKPEHELTIKCSRLHQLVLDTLQSPGMLERLERLEDKPLWLRQAIEHSKADDKYDMFGLALGVCLGLLSQHRISMDEHIQHLSNTDIYDMLGIEPAENMLLDLSDKRFELRKDGIIFEGSILVYPHQFLRRYFSSSFVGMPSLLKRFMDSGAKVSIRLDPLRITDAINYRDGPIEADFWHGPPFSEKILNDKRMSDRTLHRSSGLYNLTYDAEFTVFRTKMMDNDEREFSVEEYCPVILRHGEWSSGVGEKMCIQKFAHFVFDQNQQSFTHIDGAVRVFDVDEYARCFETIKRGDDIDEKAGKRHKLFLVEGQLDTLATQQLLTEWFRYNPHIEEYFTGKDIPPHITYEQLAETRAKTRK